MSIPAALACFHFRPLFYLLHNDVDDRVGRSFLLSLLLLVDALPAAATRRVDGDNDDVVDVASTELHAEGWAKGRDRDRQALHIIIALPEHAVWIYRPSRSLN